MEPPQQQRGRMGMARRDFEEDSCGTADGPHTGEATLQHDVRGERNYPRTRSRDASGQQKRLRRRSG